MSLSFTVPELTYEYSSLEPHISADIMQLHHDKHHRAYVDKLNTALAGMHSDQGSLVDTLKRLGELPESVRTAVRNNGGGHYNHSLFWQCMSPRGGGQPTGILNEKVIERYGSYQQFVNSFSDKAAGVFGSGWVWLQPDMSIVTTPNQDNPIMDGGDEPVLGLDVWEHAYYLDYKNVRPDYVAAWWNVVDWAFVQARYEALAD